MYVEVTNTLAVPYLTGFQRHTRELLARLPGTDEADGPYFVPVVWCDECGTFRRLTGDEEGRLATFRRPAEPPRSRSSRLGDRLPDTVATWARRMVHRPAVHRLRERLAAQRRRLRHPASHEHLAVSTWPEDSWFFDLEAAWHNHPPRSELLVWLADRGVTTSTLVADVMPEQFPQWFDAGQIRLFDRFIRAHLSHSSTFVCISEAARRDVLDFAERAGFGRDLDTPVITMGANFRQVPDDVPRPTDAPPGRYVLSVATIEPRKNHLLLLDAFDALSDRHPDLSLVFVGMPGWMTEDTIDRFEGHPLVGSRFRWLDRVDDDELDALYRHAFLCVQPSFYEGFGTPVIEALANGVPTLASTGGALPEAGGTWADYFEPDDVGELVGLIDLHLSDPAFHEARRAALTDYRPPTWEDGAAGIVAAFTPKGPNGGADGSHGRDYSA